MTTREILIRPDGSLGVIAADDLTDLGAEGQVTRRRASHIEPVNPVLRWLFHAIRRRSMDTSPAATFTRCWPCRWRVNVIGGPTWGSFRRRVDAMASEVTWLSDHLGQTLAGGGGI